MQLKARKQTDVASGFQYTSLQAITHFFKPSNNSAVAVKAAFFLVYVQSHRPIFISLTSALVQDIRSELQLALGLRFEMHEGETNESRFH